MTSPEAPILEVADLPRLALPVVEFIDKERPDIVIGCDRGARLFSLAVYSMWRELHDEKFPTLDGKLHFAKVSNSLSKHQQETQMQNVIARSGADTKRDEPLHALFLDDKANFGNTNMTTRQRFSAAYRDLHRVSFVTMFGNYGDLIASDEEYRRTYNDDPSKIGIDYEFQLDKRGVRQPVATNTMTDAARNNRLVIHQASKELGKTIREQDVDTPYRRAG